jgi:hypothetical protein
VQIGKEAGIEHVRIRKLSSSNQSSRLFGTNSFMYRPRTPCRLTLPTNISVEACWEVEGVCVRDCYVCVSVCVWFFILFAFAGGCVQEEIRFCISPECLVSIFFFARMEDEEVGI